MGLFSFLKSAKPLYADKVWKTKPMAWRGMITDALTSITKNEVPIVFSFFESTKSEILSFLTEKNVPYYSLTSELIGEAAQHEKVVFVCDAEFALSSAFVSLLKGWQAKETVSFLFAGHYPLPTKEDKVLQKLNTSFPQYPITFYSSLDEPVFEIFGSERMIGLLDKLGMKEDEAIEHVMVSQSMKRARIKIESGVTKELPAQSEQEWFAKNVKHR